MTSKERESQKEMISPIAIMNTILDKEFDQKTDISPVRLNAIMYMAELFSLKSEGIRLSMDQYLLGESFPESSMFQAKFGRLDYHSPIVKYVGDAAGNKRYYDDIGIQSIIDRARNRIGNRQDHQIIIMLSHPESSWFRKMYSPSENSNSMNWTDEDYHRDGSLYFPNTGIRD